MTGTTSSRGLQLFGVVALLVAGVFAGCGGNGKTGDAAQTGDDAGQGSDGGTFGEGGIIGSGTIKSMVISPSNATITSNNGAPVTQPYTLNVTYANGTVTPVSVGVTWTTDSPVIGAIDSTGLYTANGSLGGVVQVSASYMGQSASAPLAVKLLAPAEPRQRVPGRVQTGLQGATTPDANVVWAYPYDGTVWARGLLPPTLQWNGGAATDDYYVHVVSPTFELQEFTTATGAPSSQLLLDATTWGQLTDSTSGATQVTVARWDGTADTVIANADVDRRARVDPQHHLLLVEQPRARAAHPARRRRSPTTSRNQPPLSDPTQYQQDSCLMTCHTVSADGSTHRERRRHVRRELRPRDRAADALARRHVGLRPERRGRAGLAEHPVGGPGAVAGPASTSSTTRWPRAASRDYSGPSTVMGLFTTADGHARGEAAA